VASLAFGVRARTAAENHSRPLDRLGLDQEKRRPNVARTSDKGHRSRTPQCMAVSARPASPRSVSQASCSGCAVRFTCTAIGQRFAMVSNGGGRTPVSENQRACRVAAAPILLNGLIVATCNWDSAFGQRPPNSLARGTSLASTWTAARTPIMAHSRSL
jgi:hypothetical protein